MFYVSCVHNRLRSFTKRVNCFHLPSEIAKTVISKWGGGRPMIRTLIIIHTLLSFPRERNSMGIRWGFKMDTLRVTSAFLNRTKKHLVKLVLTI